MNVSLDDEVDDQTHLDVIDDEMPDDEASMQHLDIRQQLAEVDDEELWRLDIVVGDALDDNDDDDCL